MRVSPKEPTVYYSQNTNSLRPKSTLSNIYIVSAILFITLRLMLAKVSQEGVMSDVIVFLGTEQRIVARQARRTRRPRKKSTSIHGSSTKYTWLELNIINIRR